MYLYLKNQYAFLNYYTMLSGNQLFAIDGQHPRCWRLVKDMGDGNGAEEVVVHVQGIVADLDLPPISQ